MVSICAISNPFDYFQQRDKDSDYLLSSIEEPAAYNKHRAADQNHDGAINLQEFLIFLEQKCPQLKIEESWRQTAALIVRGQIYHQKKQYAKAEIDFNQALKLRPDDANLYYILGDLSTVQRNFPAAKKSLKLALQKNPSHIYANTLMGYALYNQEIPNFSEAEIYLNKALRLAPDNPAIEFMAGMLFLTKAKTALKGERYLALQLAKSHLENALSLDPDSVMAKQGLNEVNRQLAPYQTEP